MGFFELPQKVFDIINGTNWTRTLETDYDMWDLARFSRNDNEEVSWLEVLFLRHPNFVFLLPALFIPLIFGIFLFGIGGRIGNENGQNNIPRNARNGDVGGGDIRPPIDVRRAEARGRRARDRFGGGLSWFLFAVLIWGYYILSQKSPSELKMLSSTFSNSSQDFHTQIRRASFIDSAPFLEESTHLSESFGSINATELSRIRKASKPPYLYCDQPIPLSSRQGEKGEYFGLELNTTVNYLRQTKSGAHLFRVDIEVYNHGSMVFQLLTAERILFGDYLPHPIDPKHPFNHHKFTDYIRKKNREKREEVSSSMTHNYRGKKNIKGEWIPSFQYNSAEAGGLGKLSASVLEPNGETSLSFIASLPTARASFHGSLQFQILKTDHKHRAARQRLLSKLRTHLMEPPRPPEREDLGEEGLGEDFGEEHEDEAYDDKEEGDGDDDDEEDNDELNRDVNRSWKKVAVQEAEAVYRAKLKEYHHLEGRINKIVNDYYPLVGTWISISVNRVALLDVSLDASSSSTSPIRGGEEEAEEERFYNNEGNEVKVDELIDPLYGYCTKEEKYQQRIYQKYQHYREITNKIRNSLLLNEWTQPHFNSNLKKTSISSSSPTSNMIDLFEMHSFEHFQQMMDHDFKTKHALESSLRRKEGKEDNENTEMDDFENDRARRKNKKRDGMKNENEIEDNEEEDIVSSAVSVTERIVIGFRMIYVDTEQRNEVEDEELDELIYSINDDLLFNDDVAESFFIPYSNGYTGSSSSSSGGGGGGGGAHTSGSPSSSSSGGVRVTSSEQVTTHSWTIQSMLIQFQLSISSQVKALFRSIFSYIAVAMNDESTFYELFPKYNQQDDEGYDDEGYFDLIEKKREAMKYLFFNHHRQPQSQGEWFHHLDFVNSLSSSQIRQQQDNEQRLEERQQQEEKDQNEEEDEDETEDDEDDDQAGQKDYGQTSSFSKQSQASLPALRFHEEVICEGSCKLLTCSDPNEIALGRTHVHIIASTIGRTKIEACPHVASHRLDCNKDVTAKVKNQCKKNHIFTSTFHRNRHHNNDGQSTSSSSLNNDPVEVEEASCSDGSTLTSENHQCSNPDYSYQFNSAGLADGSGGSSNSGSSSGGSSGDDDGVTGSGCQICEGVDGVGGDPFFCENVHKYVNVTYTCLTKHQIDTVNHIQDQRDLFMKERMKAKKQTMYKFEYTGMILNGGTTSVAIIHHKFLFSAKDFEEEEGVGSFASDVKGINKQSSSSMMEIVEEGAGVGGGHDHGASGLVILPPDDESGGIRLHGHILLPSRVGVRMTGYFTVVKTHPLISAASNFLLTMLGPKLFQFVTLQAEEVTTNNDSNDDDANKDEIDDVMEEYGKQDRKTIMSVLSLGGLVQARNFQATVGPLKLRDHHVRPRRNKLNK